MKDSMKTKMNGSDSHQCEFPVLWILSCFLVMYRTIPLFCNPFVHMVRQLILPICFCTFSIYLHLVIFCLAP